MNATPFRLAVVGGGPAGLMAAEAVATAVGLGDVQITVYDAMPSVGRKFLLAGRGGLNLTHAEPFAPFVSRYGLAQSALEPMLAEFGAVQLRQWAHDLGVNTFVGSSGRVFPADMKAAPLLRAWLHRLRGLGIKFCMRHRWQGWTDSGALQFSTPPGLSLIHADAVVLALGGGSWSRLGSDGAWLPLLAARGVGVMPLLPSNCGFDVARRRTLDMDGDQPGTSGWSPFFSSKFAGTPFKSVAIRFTDSQGRPFCQRGEFVATATGVEGSLIYAVSALLRGEIAHNSKAVFLLDLLPDKTPDQVRLQLLHPRGARSLSSHLKSRLGIDGIKSAILYEVLDKLTISDPMRLASAIKALPITLSAPRPLDEAISSAGGVLFDQLDTLLKLKEAKGISCPVFFAGEMLDWEAPTGGYLLTACFASGRRAGAGVLNYLKLLPK